MRMHQLSTNLSLFTCILGLKSVVLGGARAPAGPPCRRHCASMLGMALLVLQPPTPRARTGTTGCRRASSML